MTVRISRGELIAGRFTIVKPLYRADTFHAREGKRHLAIELVPDDADLDRLRDGIAAASRLEHPNICRVLELVEGEDACAIVMELVDGAALADRLRLGPIDAVQAVALVEQLLSALACAHAAGIVHGDVSPATVVIDASGRAKLVDLGVRGAHDRKARGDLRAVGMLAYAMLTGDLSGTVQPQLVPAELRPWISRATSRLLPFATASAAAAALTGDQPSRSRAPLFAGAVAAVALVATLGIWASRTRTSTADPLTASIANATLPHPNVRPPLPTGAIEPPDQPPLPTGAVIPAFVPPRAESAPIRRAPAALATISFSAESTWIEDGAVFVLEDAHRQLVKNPQTRIEISGHSSADGEEDKNRQMSLLRAMSVKSYLVTNGIDEHRIEIVGRGATSPIATNATAEGRARNRRVEIRPLP